MVSKVESWVQEKQRTSPPVWFLIEDGICEMPFGWIASMKLGMEDNKKKLP